MGQEFIIKSQLIEDKINQLLPSQGGFQAGVDFSASTTVIPIVDLTETAEGSNLRQDLQRAISLTSATTFDVRGGTNTDIILNTGYWRIIGTVFFPYLNATDLGDFQINLFDGSTRKTVFGHKAVAVGAGFNTNNISVDLDVYLPAGHTCDVTTTQYVRFQGSVRQLADINGNLINPL
tara:strand:+ start:184 stop:717 length:534 start_codon:yes stop_codon:yes gene_type:complete